MTSTGTVLVAARRVISSGLRPERTAASAISARMRFKFSSRAWQRCASSSFDNFSIVQIRPFYYHFIVKMYRPIGEEPFHRFFLLRPIPSVSSWTKGSYDREFSSSVVNTSQIT